MRYNGKWMIVVTDVPHFQMTTHQTDQGRQLEESCNQNDYYSLKKNV